MVIDAVRGYLQLANGLTEVTRQRALSAAKVLVTYTGTGGEHAVPDQLSRQVQGLAEELVATSRANRDLLVSVVRGEIERAVTRLGLVRAEEYARQERALTRLENRLAALESAPERRLAVGATPGPTETTRESAREPESKAGQAKESATGGQAEPKAPRKPATRSTRAKTTPPRRSGEAKPALSPTTRSVTRTSTRTSGVKGAAVKDTGVKEAGVKEAGSEKPAGRSGTRRGAAAKETSAKETPAKGTVSAAAGRRAAKETEVGKVPVRARKTAAARSPLATPPVTRSAVPAPQRSTGSSSASAADTSASAADTASPVATPVPPAVAATGAEPDPARRPGAPVAAPLFTAAAAQQHPLPADQEPAPSNKAVPKPTPEAAP